MHTDSNNPSKSLIKRICYPESFKVITPSIRWGLERETSALTEYHIQIKYKHYFNQNWVSYMPFLSTVWCHSRQHRTVHMLWKGVVEVKCPYTPLFSSDAPKTATPPTTCTTDDLLEENSCEKCQTEEWGTIDWL